MRLVPLLILTCVLFSGCSLFHSNRETAVDSELSQGVSSSQAPSVEPGDPQAGFKQEVPGAQNP
ncbi:MAG TPA: hypothetical protein VL688_08595 [Verrucomicrobiae bacterium]|nr:hypothetical protein [Verrucomicrobiae bacterium]